MDLQRKGLVDLDALDDLAAALKLGGARPVHDPNRPNPSSQANRGKSSTTSPSNTPRRHLAPEKISAAILQTEKRQLAFEGSRLAEDPTPRLPVCAKRSTSFSTSLRARLVAPREDVIGTRAALVRRLLTDQLDFISVAKRFIRVREFGDVIDHIIPTDGQLGPARGQGRRPDPRQRDPQPGQAARAS